MEGESHPNKITATELFLDTLDRIRREPQPDPSKLPPPMELDRQGPRLRWGIYRILKDWKQREVPRDILNSTP
ncbi:MAG: hypothetical protein G01um10147_984 [Microgenomates group bacterium Gr01-1014_7]|nr:MAG: hypothetical protein G01um10147_984 [Microgenomates group bacterium Gr01-1014_7]